MTNTTLDTKPGDELPTEAFRRARLSRDPRFDGEFFVAVRTTGIYCRPICPARTPAEKNVSYFIDAAQAAQAGYRPCLRCRPESAPGSPAWLGSSTTVQRALGLIKQGALNEGSIAALAERLGVGDRYLRKLFQQELGVSPQAIALNQRLLFARKLLAETSLSITDVAFAAGFGSVRRFNSAVQTQFRTTPGSLRKRHATGRTGPGIRLLLQYRPPYDWPGTIDFFKRHALEGVEQVGEHSYQRNLLLHGAPASFSVRPVANKDALQLELHLPDHGLLLPIVNRVRRMFDLDANPAVIAQALRGDVRLAQLLAAFPGIRAPGCWSIFESSVRTIVGQQVSIAAARGICARLAQASSTDPQHVTFPSAGAIAALEDHHFPMPRQRRDSLRNLCQQFNGSEDQLDLGRLAELPGVGPWTVAVVAMRGCGDPDVFPTRDLGLEKAWQDLGGTTRLGDQALAWQPWRSYAANLLWRSLSL